jgi:hypothetical protein
MLNVIMLSVIMLSVIMLNVVMLNVIMLSVVMLNVAAQLVKHLPTNFKGKGSNQAIVRCREKILG